MSRGIAKFNAFKALTEHEEQMGKVIEDKRKIERPILSEDKLERINEELSYSLEYNTSVIVTYFKNGYLLNEHGLVNVDIYSKLLKINGLIIKFSDVVDVVGEK